MSDKRETTIPFSGFYHSLHDIELDNALNFMFSDESGEPIAGLVERAFDKVQWEAVHLAYANKYAKAFACKFNFNTLTFRALLSPKYYNFETDRILCEIDIGEVEGVFAKTDKTSLNARIKARFTSRDGFISFYANSLDAWDADIAKWDHNQIGTLIEVYITQESGGEYDEYDVLESCEVANRVIEENIEGADRLYRIADYLRARAQRI